VSMISSCMFGSPSLILCKVFKGKDLSPDFRIRSFAVNGEGPALGRACFLKFPNKDVLSLFLYFYFTKWRITHGHFGWVGEVIGGALVAEFSRGAGGLTGILGLGTWMNGAELCSGRFAPLGNAGVLRFAQNDKRKATAKSNSKSQSKATADCSAALRNDKQKMLRSDKTKNGQRPTADSFFPLWLRSGWRGTLNFAAYSLDHCGGGGL
jgi:hypothetical protein